MKSAHVSSQKTARFPGETVQPSSVVQAQATIGVLQGLQGVVAIGRFLHLATIRVGPGRNLEGRQAYLMDFEWI